MKQYRPHLVALGLLAFAWLAGLSAGLLNLSSDKRFTWLKRPAGGTIALVEIDAPSLARIGVWPWPRRLHAELLTKLEAAGATEIVFDVDFSARSNAVDDAAFAEALARAGGSVVLASFQQVAGDSARGRTLHVNRPLPEFARHSWPAVVNVSPERDGLVRRYGFGGRIDGEFLPSLGALLAGRHDQHGRPFRIDFGIDGTSVPAVSYSAVLEGDAPTLARLNGRKVIVAGTAIELGDRFNVPNGRVIPGSLLQALAAESLLQGRNLQITALPVSLAGLLVVAAAMIWLWRRASAKVRLAVVLCGSAALEIGALLVQANWPVIVDTSLWQILLAAYLATVALDEIDRRGLLRGIAERRFQKIAMSLGDGLACLDSDMRITFWNPGAARIFGYASEEALGMAFSACLADPERLDLRALARHREAGESHAANIHVVELVGRRCNGESFALEASISTWQGTDELQFGVVLRDITVKQREREHIRYLAEHDVLTALFNRHALTEHLSAGLGGGAAGALIIVSIDRFQQFNDIHGREFGDQMLCAFAERLCTLAPSGARVARIADDEFALATTGEAAARLARDIATEFQSRALAFGAWRQRATIRTAYAVAEEGWSADQLIGNAHLALEAARGEREDQPVAFESAMRDKVARRMRLETELRSALEHGEFELFYQPQLRLADQSVVGAEALIRWRHPGRGLVSPGEFMPVINHSSISDAVANWVLVTACRQARQWQVAGTPIRVGVNLSPSQMESGDLAETVAAELAETGLDPRLLELEVTEDILLDDEKKAHAIFGQIRALGVSTAFDDFGTGHGSLSYLKKFPLDTLKVDQSFVRHLLSDAGDAAIVRATVELGQSLGLSIIAEGIEDAETAAHLARMGCDEGQGYHFGRPVPASEFNERFLAPRRVA